MQEFSCRYRRSCAGSSREFKKAVDEEVKNERMKTELVTNVSHDLRTPLTAIITYTDLLKNETDPEKQKEYIEVLERKIFSGSKC